MSGQERMHHFPLASNSPTDHTSYSFLYNRGRLAIAHQSTYFTHFCEQKHRSVDNLALSAMESFDLAQSVRLKV
jgi:isochorismate hydrolase